MIEIKTSVKKSRSQLSFVPRQAATESIRMKHFHNEVNTPSAKETHKTVYGHWSSIPLEEIYLERKPKTETTTISPLDHNDQTKNNRVLLFNADKPSVISSNEMFTPNTIRNPSHNANGCLDRLTRKQLLLLTRATIFLLIDGMAMLGIFTPVYMLVIRRFISQSSFTNMTASICSTTICIGKETLYHSSIVTLLHPFDGIANDLTGYGTGTLLGSSAPGYQIFCCVGSHFTLQVWLSLQSNPLTGDFGVFDQCDSNFRCIGITLRNGHFTISFDSMNTDATLTGTTVVSLYDFVHLTVAHDATLYQPQIYVNGLLDAVSNGMVSNYQGNSLGLVTTIGKTRTLAYEASYFNGKRKIFDFQ
ncbi:unnamed protein product [Rotaria magnacalcarata]|uniref:Uncharacterized protein n=3 Tax=Rotaria magnacalcarata TaxID=392030 RepID=A0A815GL71_9BILA|nr:unnamed protein product [Rotaria magnacalcarata]CAF3864025.1 unnamed protein product [Rotaria magnacalcarata]CAF3865588.1 unnamed protein product [Rotaria magnacalcarata]